MRKTTPVTVTRPSLPPLEEVMPYLEQIWRSGTLTNCGPLHQQLETVLASRLGVPYISLFNNGTIALMTALKALGLDGEIITTPYSFVATANAIAWNGLTPVFADIDPTTLNISAAAIEAAITERTSAIMPVHCYGIPCATEAIANVARRHNLKVIYDAAHAFAVEDAGGSVLRHGDLAVLSLHATKVFNTFEGGAIISHSIEMKKHIDALRNFGLADETTMLGIGCNGKMSEINAAIGLAQVAHIDATLKRRGDIAARYRAALRDITGIIIPPNSAVRQNYSYFPILVTADAPISRDDLYAHLQHAGIYARRYFYPLICDFSPYRNAPGSGDVAHARTAAHQVLCLPIYADLSDTDTERVLSGVLEAVS